MDKEASKEWPVERIYKNESGYTVTVYKSAYLFRAIYFSQWEDGDEEMVGQQNSLHK